MRSRYVAAVLCVILAAALSACSDDSDSDDSAPADAQDVSGDDSSNDDASGDDDSGDELTGDDAVDAIEDVELGISARAAGLEAALNADIEVVDDTNLKITFDSGTVDTDSIGDCAVINAILEDGETATVVYPDGEKTC